MVEQIRGTGTDLLDAYRPLIALVKEFADVAARATLEDFHSGEICMDPEKDAVRISLSSGEGKKVAFISAGVRPDSGGSAIDLTCEPAGRIRDDDFDFLSSHASEVLMSLRAAQAALDPEDAAPLDWRHVSGTQAVLTIPQGRVADVTATVQRVLPRLYPAPDVQ